MENPQQQLERAFEDESALISNEMIDVLGDIARERQRQDERWGADRQLDDTLWYTILGEEYGEVGRAILEGMDGGDEANAPEPTGEPDQHLYNELIQVAAVAACHAEAVRARRFEEEIA